MLAGRQWKILAWLLSVLLFMGYLMGANRICRAIDGKSYLRKLPPDVVLPANWNLNITRWFSPRPVNNKFEEGVAYLGQFDSVSNRTGTARLRVFFRSREAVYEVAENRRSFLEAATNVMTASFFLPTSGLKPDVYTMGLMMCGADGGKFAWVDSSFEKKAGGPKKYVARPVDVRPARTRDDLKFVLESVIEKRWGKPERFSLLGWMSIDTGQLDEYNAYLLIEDAAGVTKALYAPLLTRLDVAPADAGERVGGFHLKLHPRVFVIGAHLVKVALESRRTGEIVESAQTAKIHADGRIEKTYSGGR